MAKGESKVREYHKIDSIFKRDMTKPNNPFIIGEYSRPEFEYLKDNKWEWTEKVDGTNIRVMYVNGAIDFRGKSDNAMIPPHLLKKLQQMFSAERMACAFNCDACLYGEGFGYKIQGKVGIDYLQTDVDFYLFDVRVGEWWLKRDNVAEVAEKLGLRAPIIAGYGTINEAIEYVRGGFKSAIGTADAEGLVLRPTIELLDRGGNRIITKVKTRDFRGET